MSRLIKPTIFADISVCSLNDATDQLLTYIPTPALIVVRVARGSVVKASDIIKKVEPIAEKTLDVKYLLKADENYKYDAWSISCGEFVIFNEGAG